MTDAIAVMTTVGDEDQARSLCRLLVESRLVACAQILPPITSLYQWEGRLEESREWLILFKTSQSAWDPLVEMVQQHHPYRNPELIALPVIAGSTAYLKWITASLDR